MESFAWQPKKLALYLLGYKEGRAVDVGGRMVAATG